MRTLPKNILKHPYERVLIPEDEGGFSAYISEFEGCFAEGESAEEALRNLESTALAWLEAEQEAGREIPAAWNEQEYSGKLLLRIPKSLHKQLARYALKDGVSLNQYVLRRLAESGKETQIASMILDRFQDCTAKIFGMYRSSSQSLTPKEIKGFKDSEREFAGRDLRTGQFVSATNVRSRSGTSRVERVPKSRSRSTKTS